MTTDETAECTLCFRNLIRLIKKNLSTLEAKVSILFPNHVYGLPQGGGGSIRENSKTTSEESLLSINFCNSESTCPH